MTHPTQTAHKAALKKAHKALLGASWLLRPALNVTCRAYLAHFRPQIEAAAREAALREALAICRRENWDDAAENAILALITKEPEA
jgi:hypothetical protein